MTAVAVSAIFITSWEELKFDTAATLLELRYNLTVALSQKNHILVGIIKTYIVKFLLKKKKIFKLLSPAQINDIADDLTFIHRPWHTFHCTWINTRLGRIYPPTEKLFSFTFWQLIHADAEYSKYLVLNFRNDKEKAHTLDRFIAILYLKIPGQFTDADIEDYSIALSNRLPEAYKTLILQTYANCRKYISGDRCPTLFSAGSQQAQDESTEPQEPIHTGRMWQSMLFDLSETPAFRGLENAKSARVYDALDYLEKKAIETKNQASK